METRNGNQKFDQKIDTVAERVKGLVDQGADKVDQLRSRAMDVKQQAFDRGNAMVDRASTYIKANPIKSVAIAFGVGYIGMRLFRR
jgi:ElaB/YqjD/DUF883 family membrane-anchored ribosome-binding protein